MKFVRKMFFIIVIMVVIFANTSFSFGFSLSSILEKGNTYVKEGAGGEEVWDAGKIADVVNPIASALTAIGVTILVGAFLVLGINYITGGADKQAQSKQQAIGLVVSAIVIFGAVGIWKLCYSILIRTGL